MPDPTADHLPDIAAIHRLKARYFRTLDTQDWDGYRAVFTTDVHIDTTDDAGPGGLIDGVEAYLEMLRPMLAGAVTTHHGHTPEIDITGPDTASGIWAMEDHVRFPDGPHLWGAGWYHEQYRREAAGWRIASMVLRRQRVEMDGTVTFPR